MVEIQTKGRVSSIRARLYPGMEAVRWLCYGCILLVIVSFTLSCVQVWYLWDARSLSVSPLETPDPMEPRVLNIKIVATGLTIMFHSVPLVFFSFVASFIKVILDIQDNTLRTSRR